MTTSSYQAMHAAPAQVGHTSSAIERLLRLDLDKIDDRAVLRGKVAARITDVYDGDTLTAAFINGFDQPEKSRIRIYGMDTPEIKGETSIAGRNARNAALVYMGASEAQSLPIGPQMRKYFVERPCIVELEFVPEREKYGRLLAIIRTFSCTETLAEYLMRLGHAKPYGGGTKDQGEYLNPAQVVDLDGMKASEGFKNEVLAETIVINRIWQLVDADKSKYAAIGSKLDRKAITRKLRKTEGMTAEQFLA